MIRKVSLFVLFVTFAFSSASAESIAEALQHECPNDSKAVQAFLPRVPTRLAVRHMHGIEEVGPEYRTAVECSPCNTSLICQKMKLAIDIFSLLPYQDLIKEAAVKRNVRQEKTQGLLTKFNFQDFKNDVFFDLSLNFSIFELRTIQATLSKSDKPTSPSLLNEEQGRVREFAEQYSI